LPEYNPITPSDPLSTSVGDINTAFDSVATAFQGATAPSSPVPYQSWIDTGGTDTLKIRNSGNSAWVPALQLGSQTGPVMAQGTKSITVRAPASITTTYTLTMPAAQGGSNQYLKNDGSGGLTWETLGAGVNALPDLSDVTITAAVDGEYLRHDGSVWRDSGLQVIDLTVASAARGDLIARGASTFGRLAVGTNGQVLSSNGTDPVWSSTAAGVAWTTITPSNGVEITADTSSDSLTMTDGTGINITGSASPDDITIATVASEIDHNGLLNYDANKHPDVSGTVNVVGSWTFTSPVASRVTSFLATGTLNTHDIKVDGDFCFDRGVNDSAITTATLTAVRTWTMPDATGTVTVLGNTTTGTGSIARGVSPTITTSTLAAATMSGTLTFNSAVGILFNTSTSSISITAPGSAAGYSLTLPSGGLPTSGKYYLLVDNGGQLSFGTSAGS